MTVDVLELFQIVLRQSIAEQIDLLQIWTGGQVTETGMFGKFCWKESGCQWTA